MAGIDKTYLNTYNQYLEILDWCNKTSIVTDKYGNTFNPKNYMYCPNLEEKDFNAGMVLWNTPVFFDMYLIRYCPVTFIQERLKEQYSEDFIKKTLKFQTEYDTFKRNGLGKNTKATILKRPQFRGHYDTVWWISVENPDWSYNTYEDTWVNKYECKEHNTNICSKYRGKLMLRKIMRILRKWNLPKGLTVNIRGSYIGQEWILKTK